MQTCVLFSGCPVSNSMRDCIPKGAFILAADAGWRHAIHLGIQPDLVVGDFDSSGLPDFTCETIQLPPEKDDTDTHFAVREALRRGFKKIIILGGLGGRPDHAFANYVTLRFLAQNGVENLLADEHTQVRCMGPGTLHLSRKPAHYLSVFPFDGIAEGVQLSGVKYPLQDAMLTSSHPLGVSNEFAAPTATIVCRQGFLLVMLVKKDIPDTAMVK